ncbi:MAG: DUF488 family protein [Candidatus Poribacteria bacterium]|nr:DUF488 family protein [Candidatus Poribacteria bacterium]
MLIRQKVILSLIDQMGGQMLDGTQEKVSRLQLVKWAFLLEKETKMKTFYQFVPYHYGPFSFTLYHELKGLIRNNYIIEPSKDEIQRSSDVAAPSIDSALGNEINDFSKKYHSLSTEELIDHVYAHYPWFTINAKKPENRKKKRPEGKCAVYTAGYEGLHIDGFLNILLEAGIQQVIDVRCNPVSRRYGFHKSTLSNLCKRLKIQYRHVPEVGIPSESRANLQQPSDYTKLFQNYKEKVLTTQQDVIKKIADWVKSQPSVLVCMEANPCFCHRSHLAVQIANHTKFPIEHLRRNPCKQSTLKPKFSLPL